MTFHVYGFRIHSFIRETIDLWCLLALLVIAVLGVDLGGFDFVSARNQLSLVENLATGDNIHALPLPYARLTEWNNIQIAHEILGFSWFESLPPMGTVTMAPASDTGDCGFFPSGGHNAVSIPVIALVREGFNLDVVGRARGLEKRWLLRGKPMGNLSWCPPLDVLIDSTDLARLILLSRDMPQLVERQNQAEKVAEMADETRKKNLLEQWNNQLKEASSVVFVARP